MKQEYTLLRPVKSQALRLIFGADNTLERELDPYEVMEQTILQFKKFAINRFFWFIVDLKNWITVCGGGDFEHMTPLTQADFFNANHERIHNITYPPDLDQVNAFSKFWVTFYLSLPPERRSHVKMTLYFRVRNTQEEYYWIMVQYLDNILDNNNMFVYGLVLATDISHLKKDGEPMMSILDTYAGDCQQFFCTDKYELAKKELTGSITAREREILYYLVNGFSSKQIAAQLDVSIKTIDNHRQNMLRKTRCKSTPELIAHAIKKGYL